MNEAIFVGLQVHKATVTVAAAESRRGGEMRHFSTSQNYVQLVAKLMDRLAKDGQRLNFC